MHKKHIKCNVCNHALYRTKSKNEKPEKNDEYKFCRNPECEGFCGEDKIIKDPICLNIDRKDGEITQKIRSAVRKQIFEKKDLLSYALTIVVFAQEISLFDIAEKLIDKYNLNEIYGVGRYGQEDN